MEQRCILEALRHRRSSRIRECEWRPLLISTREYDLLSTGFPVRSTQKDRPRGW